MTSLILTIAGQRLRISGEELEVEIVERDDDSELNGIADYGAYLDERFPSQKANTRDRHEAVTTDPIEKTDFSIDQNVTLRADAEALGSAVEPGAPISQSASPVALDGCSPVTTPGADESVVENSNSSAPSPRQTDTPAGPIPLTQPAGTNSNLSGLTSSQALTDMAGAETPPSAPASFYADGATRLVPRHVQTHPVGLYRGLA